MLTAGTVTQLLVTDKKVILESTAFTAGTPPVAYQWHRSTTSGFTPSGGTALAGKTALLLEDTTVIPGTNYYYKLVGVDAVPDTATTAQSAVTTGAPVQDPNQFAQTAQLGMLDLKDSLGTISVQIDASVVTALRAGQAVKVVDSAGGIPKVIACSANADDCAGFLNYDVKSPSFKAGDRAEMSMEGNVMFLYATEAIPRFGRVTLDINTIGGVQVVVATERILGIAIDKASGAGLIRVLLKTPSNTFAV